MESASSAPAANSPPTAFQTSPQELLANACAFVDNPMTQTTAGGLARVCPVAAVLTFGLLYMLTGYVQAIFDGKVEGLSQLKANPDPYRISRKLRLLGFLIADAFGVSVSEMFDNMAEAERAEHAECPHSICSPILKVRHSCSSEGRAETARPSRLFALWHLDAASIVPKFIASMLAAAPSDLPSAALALSTMGAPQSDCLVNLQLLN